MFHFSAVLSLATLLTALNIFSWGTLASNIENASSHVLKTLPKSSGVQAYRSILARYGGGQSLSKRDDGTQELHPYTWDSQYLCPIEFGTPPQLLDLAFDTGSSDLWVFSPEVPAWQKNGQSEYVVNASSTSRLLPNATWAIKYGDGSSSNGYVVLDVVRIGGIAAASQAVEVARNVSSYFYGNPDADGIIGFGFSSKNKVKPKAQKTWYDSIKSTLSQDLFTLDLQHNATSSVDFGFVNETKYNGDIHYLPITTTHQGAWGFNGTGFAVGDGPFRQSRIDGIVDSGSSLMIIDNAILTEYYGGVLGSTYNATELMYLIPCNATLPCLTVGLGTYNGIVPGEYINFGPTDYAPDMCYGSLQSNDGLNLSIYGDVFLKTQFVVYDDKNLRVGFAEKDINL